jgi:hypothetical protein
VAQTARSALSTDVRDGVKDAQIDAGGPQTKGRADAQSRSRRSEGDRLDDLAMQAAKSADMGLRYDPESAEVEFSGRTLDVWRRDLQISVPLTAFLGRVLIDFQRGVEAENRPLRARQFMEIIAGLGPAFIKAGQALSSRPDLLPPEYLKELQKLQDRLPPFSNQKAFEIIEEQLGVPMSEVFERVEPDPVAAASIGQVYKGYLRTGEAVAIKVQRPEIEDVIGLDIYILRQLSGTLSQMIKVTLLPLALRDCGPPQYSPVLVTLAHMTFSCFLARCLSGSLSLVRVLALFSFHLPSPSPSFFLFLCLPFSFLSLSLLLLLTYWVAVSAAAATGHRPPLHRGGVWKAHL